MFLPGAGTKPEMTMKKNKTSELADEDLRDSDLEYDQDRPEPGQAGQSGDTQGIPGDEVEGSESVRELLEEGQAWEAGIVSGIENAPNATEGPVRTHEVPEDDVPLEYIEKDPGDQR
jgi:hypothetical protein